MLPQEITRTVEAAGSTLIEPKDGETILVKVAEKADVLERGTGTYAIRVELSPNATATYRALNRKAKVTRDAHLSDDASLIWVDVLVGGGKSSVTTNLKGKGSVSEYHSIFLGKNDDEYAIASRMNHTGSRSTSNMRTRGVMLDAAKGDYEGLINIHEDAEGCDAYQKEDTLILSPDARMHATPNLEISNENVRCSHGVSLSRVDEEQIFYFRSRGIPEQEAVNIIVHGFFDEVLEMMGSHAEEARKMVFYKMGVIDG